MSSPIPSRRRVVIKEYKDGEDSTPQPPPPATPSLPTSKHSWADSFPSASIIFTYIVPFAIILTAIVLSIMGFNGATFGELLDGSWSSIHWGLSLMMGDGGDDNTPTAHLEWATHAKGVISAPPRTPQNRETIQEPPPQSTMACFTLMEYSRRFIATDRQHARGEHFFRCGTRLVDLETETRKDVLLSCEKHAPNSEEQTQFSSFRVVLTPMEVEWHRQQSLNAASQVIPLSRLNDDYCDCLDGTDEVLTNACSMAGYGMALAGARWKQYVTANQFVRLYEDDGAAAGTGGSVKSLLYSLGGPVLPFQCRGDPAVWLAPSMVGDGIVDCCDGSDETDASSHSQWLSRRQSLEAFLSGQQQQQQQHAQWYADKLHPYYTSAEAVLVDKGYDSLFTCHEVQDVRHKSASLMLKRVQRGHAEMRLRKIRGWDALGKTLLNSINHLSEELANMTRETESLYNAITHQMRVRGVASPLEAGISPSVLQRYEMLLRDQHMVGHQRTMNQIFTTQHVFGEHYEYYTLYNSPLRIAANDIVHGDVSDSPAILEERALRRATLTQVIAGMTERHTVPHVDNISYVMFAVEMGRAAVAVQGYDLETEGELVARRLGLIEPHEPYTPNVMGAVKDPMERSPVIVLGQWRPFDVTNTTAGGMSLTDPAGDVDLPRRAMVKPATQLTRGGGRLQWPSRRPQPARTIKLDQFSQAASVEGNGDVSANRLREAFSKNKNGGEKAEGVRVSVLPHTATSHYLPVHVFSGGMALCHDDNTHHGEQRLQKMTTAARVVYVCDDEDTVLSWKTNGKCQHEVVVGTPSACTHWVLKEAKRRARPYGDKLLYDDYVP